MNVAKQNRITDSKVNHPTPSKPSRKMTTKTANNKHFRERIDEAVKKSEWILKAFIRFWNSLPNYYRARSCLFEYVFFSVSLWIFHIYLPSRFGLRPSSIILHTNVTWFCVCESIKEKKKNEIIIFSLSRTRRRYAEGELTEHLVNSVHESKQKEKKTVKLLKWYFSLSFSNHGVREQIFIHSNAFSFTARNGNIIRLWAAWVYGLSHCIWISLIQASFVVVLANG